MACLPARSRSQTFDYVAAMRVLLTGGTGFVGGWTAKAVSEAGHEVRFLVRNPDKLPTGAGALGVDVSDFVVGDITDRAAVRRALTGCDAVIHTAAVVAMEPGDHDAMIETNLAGAHHVLGQAVELGLDPVVHVSSTAALFQRRLRRFHADLPVAGGADGYGRSKAAVEEYARSLQSDGSPVVITYPAMVLGPPAGDQFGEAAQGVEGVARIGFIPGRHAAWTIVDVRDLAGLHAALLTRGLGPRRYLAGGTRLGVRDLAAAMSAALDRRIRVVPVPDGMLRGAGWFADRTRRLMPSSADPFTQAGMQYYTEFPPADNSAAARDLGVTFRAPQETIADTVRALDEAGLVSPGRRGGAPA
jgi:dihydroflavonol-4-reductase